MARGLRVDVGGYVYHVLNRANARITIFEKDADYAAFERILAEALLREPGVKLLAYCQMPNHWHLAVRTTRDGELGHFMKWLTVTHTARWHVHREDEGTGHVYQGRYKSFLVDDDAYFYAVCRYVERNALRAGLVKRAEAWRWGSLWRWLNPQIALDVPILTDWPTHESGRGGRPRNWRTRVNQPETEAELESLRTAAQRGSPYGRPTWCDRMVKRFKLHSTLRPSGRPQENLSKRGLTPFRQVDEDGHIPAFEFIRSTIARDIILERKALGMSQGQLARLAGVRLETISRIETGKHKANTRTIEKIARALNRAASRRRKAS